MRSLDGGPKDIYTPSAVIARRSAAIEMLRTVAGSIHELKNDSSSPIILRKLKILSDTTHPWLTHGTEDSFRQYPQTLKFRIRESRSGLGNHASDGDVHASLFRLPTRHPANLQLLTPH